MILKSFINNNKKLPNKLLKNWFNNKVNLFLYYINILVT